MEKGVFAKTLLLVDGPARANRFADSRKSGHLRGLLWKKSVFAKSCTSLMARFARIALKISNRAFEATRANRLERYENS